MKNEGLEKMKMKVKPNKKISNNEPLERRTEFEREEKETVRRRQHWKENQNENEAQGRKRMRKRRYHGKESSALEAIRELG